MALLPEKSKEYLDMIASSDHVNKDYAAVLVKLLTHELDHMRRGLYKEVGYAQDTKDEEQVETHPQHLKIGEKEEHIGNQFMAMWRKTRLHRVNAKDTTLRCCMQRKAIWV